MKILFKTSSAAAVFLCLAGKTVAASEIKTWNNPLCATGACEVEQVALHLDSILEKDFATTRMSASFKTVDKEDLKKYAFVQWIQGCLYERSSDGKIKIASRQFFGESSPFLHANWELDSASDKDPVYWSNPGAGYDPVRGIHILRHSKYASVDPVLYASAPLWGGDPDLAGDSGIFAYDDPTGSFVDNKGDYLISSLKFKICLYPLADLPKRVDSPDAPITAEAVHCFEWDQNHAYNKELGRFENAREIDPVCKGSAP